MQKIEQQADNLVVVRDSPGAVFPLLRGEDESPRCQWYQENFSHQGAESFQNISEQSPSEGVGYIFNILLLVGVSLREYLDIWVNLHVNDFNQKSDEEVTFIH